MTPFCKVIGGLVAQRRLDPASFKLEFTGNVELSGMAERLAGAVPELLASGNIEFLPPIPWREAQQRIRIARVLLIFQGTNRLTIPAKFYEYLLTGVPILSIGEEGALSEIIAETGAGVSAPPNDPAAIAAALLKTLSMPIRSSETAMRSGSRYRFPRLAQELAGHFTEVIGKAAVPAKPEPSLVARN